MYSSLLCAYPIEELSSSFAPRASNMLSSFGNRCPAKVLDVPRQADRQTDTDGNMCYATMEYDRLEWYLQ